MKHFFRVPDKKESIKIDFENEPPPSAEAPEPLYPFEHDVNTSDGSEFLDDALRMKEQPLG